MPRPWEYKMILINEVLPAAFLDSVPAIIAGENSKYRINKRYALGQNPTIMDKDEKPAPDNRVPVPFARKAVATLQGYAAKDGYITYSSDDEGGEYAAGLKREVLDPNDEELQTSELFADSLTAGHAYEILRVDEALRIKMYRINPGKGLMVYDNTLARNPIAFCHLDSEEVLKGDKIVEQDVMTVYYAGFFIEMRRDGSAWIPGEPQAHPFGSVPAIKYVCNQDELSLFEQVKALIDEHDKIISSDYANELERFANAYMLLAKEVSQGDFDEIKAKRVFDGLKAMGETGSVSDSVAFLTKPSRGGDVAEAADRFERLIYEMMMVINPADETFGGSSGIALAYKVLPMEWLAASCMAYFTKGLQRRIELIGAALQELRGLQPETITIHQRRNLPIDTASLASVAVTLKGVVSDETILRLFPADIIPDVQAELERLSLQRDPLDVLAFSDIPGEEIDEG
jgi:SPP1 family phage portal protein